MPVPSASPEMNMSEPSAPRCKLGCPPSFIRFQSWKDCKFYSHGRKDEGKKQRRQISAGNKAFWKSGGPRYLAYYLQYFSTGRLSDVYALPQSSREAAALWLSTCRDTRGSCWIWSLCHVPSPGLTLSPPCPSECGPAWHWKRGVPP